MPPVARWPAIWRASWRRACPAAPGSACRRRDGASALRSPGLFDVCLCAPYTFGRRRLRRAALGAHMRQTASGAQQFDFLKCDVASRRPRRHDHHTPRFASLACTGSIGHCDMRIRSMVPLRELGAQSANKEMKKLTVILLMAVLGILAAAPASATADDDGRICEY